MTHLPVSHQNAFPELQMHEKFCGLIVKHIYSLVKIESAWLFEPIEQWLKDNKVNLYANFVSGVTVGTLFWPRSLTDPDVW